MEKLSWRSTKIRPWRKQSVGCFSPANPNPSNHTLKLDASRSSPEVVKAGAQEAYWLTVVPAITDLALLKWETRRTEDAHRNAVLKRISVPVESVYMHPL